MRTINLLTIYFVATFLVCSAFAATGAQNGKTSSKSKSKLQAKSQALGSKKITSLKIKSSTSVSYQTEAGVVLPSVRQGDTKPILQKIPIIGEVQVENVAMKEQENNVNGATSQLPSQTIATKLEDKTEEDKNLSLLLYSARSSTMYLKDDGNDSQSVDFMFVGSYKFTPSIALATRIDYSEDLKDAYSSGLKNTQLIFVYGPIKTKVFNIALSTSAKLPTDKASQFASLTVGLGQSAKFIMNKDYLFSDKLGVEFGLGVTRNIHEYQEAESGAINTQSASTQYAEFTWSFTDKLSVLANFTHKNTWSYQDQAKDAFDFSQEISYQAHKNIGLTLGHNNAGSALKADGQSSNVEILNENSSVIYGAVSLTY